MNKLFATLGVAVIMGLGLAIPQVTLAGTTPNPYDEGINAFLESMGIEISPTDPLWYDEDFINFVQKQQEIHANAELLIDTLSDLLVGTMDLFELGSKVDDQRFGELFTLTEEDLAEMQAFKDEFQKEIDLMKQESGDLFTEMFDDFGVYDDFGPSDSDMMFDESEFEWDDSDFEFPELDYEDYLFLDGYAEPYAPVTTGNIVELHTYIESPADRDLTVTWEQTFGPEVLWLKTDSDENAVFIVPEYDPLGNDYLEFLVTVDNGKEETWDYVYVDLVMG